MYNLQTQVVPDGIGQQKDVCNVQRDITLIQMEYVQLFQIIVIHMTQQLEHVLHATQVIFLMAQHV